MPLSEIHKWDRLKSLISATTFPNNSDEIQFLFHHSLRTRPFSIILRKTLLCTLVAGFGRYTFAYGVTDQLRYVVLATAWILAIIWQTITVLQLREKRTLPQHETLMANSTVINMTGAMVVSCMVKVKDLPMSSPLIVGVYQAGLIVGDRLRLQASAKLFWLNGLCFAISEYCFWASASCSYHQVLIDCAIFVMLGMILSRAILAWMEKSERKQFLEDLEIKGVHRMAEQFRQGLGIETGHH
eukprot:jgi/Botrbrau1/4276/Bobra.0390s0016.1